MSNQSSELVNKQLLARGEVLDSKQGELSTQDRHRSNRYVPGTMASVMFQLMVAVETPAKVPCGVQMYSVSQSPSSRMVFQLPRICCSTVRNCKTVM
jgi:hypothetical protein